MRLCRVLGHSAKAPLALGKGFAERLLGKSCSAKGFFAECHVSDTLQRLCRVPDQHLAKTKTKKSQKIRKNFRERAAIS